MRAGCAAERSITRRKPQPAPRDRRVTSSTTSRQSAAAPALRETRADASSSAPVCRRPLEVDDLAHRLPLVDPAPLIEFRLVGAIEGELRVLTLQPQQEPALLLPDADAGGDCGERIAAAGDSGSSRACCRPARRRCGEARLPRAARDTSASSSCLPRRMPPWGNCQPRPPVRPPRNTSPVAAHQHDADVCAKAFGSMKSLMEA